MSARDPLDGPQRDESNDFAAPWAIHRQPQFHRDDGARTTVKDCNGEDVMHDEAYYPWAPTPEEMERIVACVNACSNIATCNLREGLVEDLESHIVELSERESAGRERAPGCGLTTLCRS